MPKRFLLPLLILAIPCAHAEKPSRPNILFISLDDLNDWIEPLGGHPDTLTPNLTRLAQRGMNFTNAHATVTACNASRASFLTGLLPTTSLVQWNHQTDIRAESAAIAAATTRAAPAATGGRRSSTASSSSKAKH